MKERAKLGKVRPVVGILICAACASLFALFFNGHAGRVIVPIIFLCVVFLVAVRYGVSAGVLGSVLATLIFATFLFAPLGSPQVDNKAARSNLAWLVLGGLAISYLLGSTPGGHEHHG